MIKTSKRRVRGIAIFIVFLALAATIVRFQGKSSSAPTFNFKDSQNEYRDLKFINKARINFVAPNIAEAQNGINQLISQNGKQRIRKQNEGNFGAYLFTVNQEDMPQIADELRKIGSIVSQVEQVDTSLVNLDFDSEAARLASYEKEQADLALVRFPADAQNKRKEALHALIHQSRSNLDRLDESQNVLLYITLSPVKSGSGSLGSAKLMLITFLKWLGILTLGTILVYFGTRVLMFILALMGIKGIGGDGPGGSYTYGNTYSNYAGYSSGYDRKSGKRKVKRVYKDKQSSSDEEENTK